MDIQKRELWDRLENEPERAYRAFESFLALPGGKRTLLEAYRQHVGNPDAVKPSDTWSGWSNTFAWRERAAAYDYHLASLRRDAYERVIEEEAVRQAREIEKTRYRFNELMTMAYERAMEWLENAQPSDFRAQDVLSIIRLHMDAVKAFEVDRQPRRDEDDWSEEDLAAGEQIIKEIETRRYLEHPDLGLEDKVDSEEGSGEDCSEESEGDQD
jgi:hypothetical protein